MRGLWLLPSLFCFVFLRLGSFQSTACALRFGCGGYFLPQGSPHRKSRDILLCATFGDQIRGHGGNLYFENTIVTSWDTDSRKPQEEFKNGRSYLNCLSEKLTGTTCAKDDMGECRMVSARGGCVVLLNRFVRIHEQPRSNRRQGCPAQFQRAESWLLFLLCSSW